MRVLLAGASGLIGTALRRSLTADGHEVRALVRHSPGGADERQWDPSSGELDPAVLDGVDAAVCLSGAGVGDHRWTTDYKRTIVSSRVDTTSTLARAIAAHGGPATLVNASAVGYYGDTGSREVTEDAPSGDSFLADVCVQWERAAKPAQDAGTRVAFLRTGLVLSGAGGLLTQLAPLFRFGLGGKLGSGQQYMPWISLTDEVAAIRFVLEHDVRGPANLSAPDPVTNAEFTEALGDVLNRPTLFAVPGIALRVVLGEFSWNALTGQRAVPEALLAAGFTFAHTDLREALRAELA